MLISIIFNVFFILFFLPNTSYAWKSITFKGKNYPSEKVFLRDIKSQHDVIEDKLLLTNDSEIQFQVTAKDEGLPDVVEMQFQGTNSVGLFNESNIKYINYGVPLLFATYGVLFWDWGTVDGFRVRDEGWFGRSTYAGGADKLAHMYSHFLINRASYDLYRNNGLSHQQSLKNSFILASTVGLLIEVGDGISHYGFAVNDLISDMVGIGFGHLLNSHPYLDELIGFQLQWANNTKDPKHKGKKFNDPIDDYNNQKYIINLRFAAIPFLRSNYLTRYINFDTGMYSRETIEPGSTEKISARTIYYGLSLNITQLLNDLFPKNDYAYYGSRISKYYQPPETGFAIDKWTEHD